MNYWLLTTEYPPFFGGGISTYCKYTALMLAQNGHQVTVFVNDDDVQDFVISTEENIRLVRFNPARTRAGSFLGHVTNVSYAFASIIKLFIEKEGAPNIVEAQEYLGIAYYLLQFKHLQYNWCRHLPVMITMHSPSFLYLEYNHVPLYKYPNYWIGEMERFCIQAADGLVSPSRYLVTEVKKRFSYQQSQTYIVPNPYLEKTMQVPSEVDSRNEIVFFGKLSAQKGTFKLLYYFKTLWDTGFDLPLYLIGGQDIVYHPEKKTMGDILKSNYKPYINQKLLILEDKIQPSDIPARLARARVVIIPSTIDNLPYVVLEMMTMGLIVLVSKQGGQAEIVEHGIDGFVFDHNDVSTFYSQLNTILKLSASQKAAISLRAKAKVQVQYSLQNVYNQKIDIVNNIIAQKRKKNHFPFVRQHVQNKQLESEYANEILSIVVPYYNMGRYIDDTMTSLSNVQIEHKEILIINDGSTDENSLEKLEKYRYKEGIKVIDTPNKGLAAARNCGAQQASGTYLAFLDADDTVAPDYYSKAIKVLKAFENIFFVGAWTQYFQDSVNIWPTFNPEPPLILNHNLINSSALVYKKTAFINAGQNDGAMPFQGLEDYDSVISMVSKGYYGVVLPEVLFHYRVRHQSMIRNISKTKKIILFEYIAKKHKQFYATFAAEIVSLIQANGPGLQLDNPSLDRIAYSNYPLLNKSINGVLSIAKSNPRLKRLLLNIYRKLKS